MTVLTEFTLNEGGLWYSLSLEREQYMQLLRTGSLPDGKSVCALKLFDFPGDDETALIYDFMLARKGVNPWRHTAVNV